MFRRLTALWSALMIMCICLCPMLVLAEDTVSSDFEISDGVLIAYLGSDRKITIPEGVTAIGRQVFFNKPVESVTLPDTVTSIGAFAFANSSVRNIDIPDSVTFAESTSFMGTPYLQALIQQNGGWLVLSNGLLVCYAGNDVNAVMPETVKQIGERAFLNRFRLKTLTIPDSVRSTGTSPFVNAQPKLIYSTNPVAKKLGIPCTAAPDIPPAKSSPALDISRDTWQFANKQTYFGDKYKLSESARLQLIENIDEPLRKFDEPWTGSCYGLVMTVLLAKYGMLTPSDIQGGTSAIGDITPDNDVQSIINYYHFLQYTEPARNINIHSGLSDVSFFENIISLALQAENQGKPFLLSFDTKDGEGHTCAGCGIESGIWKLDGKSYDRRVILWDPNFPDGYEDDICLYYRESDYDFSIPYYGVKYTYGTHSNAGVLKAASDELSVLGSPAYPFYVRGDVNADGNFDVSDTVLLQKWLLAIPDTALPQWQSADLCKDDRLDVFDFCIMKKELLYQ